MKTQTDNTKEQQNDTAPRVQQEQSTGGTATIEDHRPATVYQRKLRATMNNSPRNQATAQLRETMNVSVAGNPNPIQRKANNTGLPDTLKSGIENLSGYAMDDVKVHYNSGKPAQLQAHAYAQGTDIHIASGQEKHLPHEAWHVVQQKQGRVKPTMQLKGKVNVNDDTGLEKEADVMGARAIQQKVSHQPQQLFNGKKSTIVQRVGKGKHIIKLVFAGSGHDYITDDRNTGSEGWEFVQDVAIKRVNKSVNEDKVEEEYEIAGPGGPITKNRLRTGAPIMGKGLPKGSFDLGGNKIAKLKEVIPEWLVDILFEHPDMDLEVHIWGHSRGAVAGAYVAEMIKGIGDIKVTYSGFDPVPGMAGVTSTDPTNLSNLDRSVLVYSVGSGAGAIMKPKGIPAKTVIVTSAQHSANLKGTFALGNDVYDAWNLTEMEPGVYVEEDFIVDPALQEQGLRAGQKFVYGEARLKMVNTIGEFEAAYTRLQGINTAWKDFGRKKELRSLVEGLLG